MDVVIYGTEKTLDAYKFNLLKNKQRGCVVIHVYGAAPLF